MRRYLLDTNHASSALRPDGALRTKMSAAGEAAFHLCRRSVGELWYMVFNSTRVDDNERVLRTALSLFPILEFDEVAAIEFGRIRAELRRRGRPIPAIDAQIAAIARSGGLVVLSSDHHFAHVPGLTVEDWVTV